MMKYIQIYMLLFVVICCTSCNGQVKSNTSKPIPKVIRNFKSAALAPDFDTTLVSQYIRSIFQDSKDNLWFGTIADGVVKYDASTSLSTSVSTLTYFSTPDGFYNETVYAINEDKSGNMWFGTEQGVYKYDPSASLRAGGKTFKNYNQKDGLAHVDITRKGILVDKSGNIWVGTHGGVYRYDPVADNEGRKSFSLFKELGTLNIAGIMEDKSGNLWFATSENGVFRYDGKTITNIAEKIALGENYAGGLAQDKAGNMWFTMKNGICKYDPARRSDSASLRAGGKTLTEYTAKDGLGGTEFWGIYIEESGIIWITARGSTTRFDPSIPLPNPKAFTVFTPADGLNCCVQSMFQDKSGNMWWGTGQGLYRFNGLRFYQVKKTGPW
jgi:ligand-binding sensor domain-containing protein